ncbi:hypothetical protein ACVW17_001656 [Bradyrhizobium sp. USDA 4473]
MGLADQLHFQTSQCYPGGDILMDMILPETGSGLSGSCW